MKESVASQHLVPARTCCRCESVCTQPALRLLLSLAHEHTLFSFLSHRHYSKRFTVPKRFKDAFKLCSLDSVPSSHDQHTHIHTDIHVCIASQQRKKRGFVTMSVQHFESQLD